jgi:hypothetical protein
MNVNAMDNAPAPFPASSMVATRPAWTALVLSAMKSGAAAAVVAAVLAGHVPERFIVIGVIVVASAIGWHRTQFVPARIRSHHRFTVVSRSGDGFVTIDSSGVRRVAHRLVLDTPAN